MWPRKKQNTSYTDNVINRIEHESDEVMGQVERIHEITDKIKQRREKLEVMPNDR